MNAVTQAPRRLGAQVPVGSRPRALREHDYARI
jgi:hypothetical protein